VADASKYTPWLHNESAGRALRLFAQAAHILSAGIQECPRTAYILLDR